MGRIDWDEFAGKYDGVFLRDPAYNDLLGLVAERAGGTDCGRVLDLGCGTGNLSFLLARTCPGARFLGVDPSPKMIALFDRRFAGSDRLSSARGDALAIPAEDAAFDLVVTSLALHHVPGEERGRAAAEIRRVLRKGGSLLYADRFLDRDGPVGDAGRARDVIEKMSRWAIYCLDNGALEKSMMILESIPNDLEENGEYATTAGRWMDCLGRAGFHGMRVLEAPPAELGLKLLTAVA